MSHRYGGCLCSVSGLHQKGITLHPLALLGSRTLRRKGDKCATGPEPNGVPLGRSGRWSPDPSEGPAPPRPARSPDFRERLNTAAPHSFHSLRSMKRRRAGRRPGWGRARWSPLPAPALPALPQHMCCDSHGLACSTAGGPGARGPGDVEDTEGFVHTVTSAL